MSEWKECKLGDVVSSNNQSITNGYPYKTIQYLDTGSITEGMIDGFQEYNISDAPSRAKRLVENNDIVYSTVRPIQRHYGFIIDPPKNLVVSTGFSVIETNRAIAEPLFVYYFLISDEIVETLDVIADGSTSAYPSLKPSDIENLDIILPPLPEQRAIASVLSRLDDKIDLLHRQNKTLEAVAETLFRQWFVGEADEGWEENSLLEVIQLIGGGTPKTAITEYWDGDIPWLAGGDIASNHKSFINCSVKSITEVGLNNSSAKLLPEYATVISARGTVGKYCLLAQPMAFSQSNYGILPKPKISECFFFTYLLVNHVVDELQSSAYGSVFDTITTTTFKEIKIPLPTETEILRFEQSVSPYFKKMFLNKSQIRTLEKLRDSLLPKLMSGEVRVEV